MAERAEADLPALLAHCNPWWRHAPVAPAGSCQQASHEALQALLGAAAAPSLVVIDGGRQTGKSRLLEALVAQHLIDGIHPRRLCRLTLEHGPLRWIAPEALVEAWQGGSQATPARAGGPRAGRELLLVDDLQLWDSSAQDSLAQFALEPQRCVVVAGTGLQDCVQRWRAVGLRVAELRLRPLNFAAFVALRARPFALPPAPTSLRELFDWPPPAFAALREALAALVGLFEDYLQRGGYPAALHADSLAEAQASLREQVVMRSLRWDAARLGVRRLDQLEAVLHALAREAGSLIDMPELCARLTIERPTVRHFLDLLEQLELLRRVPPLGYGKRVLRARPLIQMVDPALAPALCWHGGEAGAAQAECALARHLQGAYGSRGGILCHAPLGTHGRILMVSAGASVLPFALHWPPGPPEPRMLTALAAWCRREGIPRSYLVSRRAVDFGVLSARAAGGAELMQLPLALLCLWLAAAEPAALDPG